MQIVKKLLALKMLLASAIVVAGLSFAPKTANAWSCDHIGDFLVCILYADNEWHVYVGPKLDLS